MIVPEPVLGSKAVEKSIVRAAINQASVPMATLTIADRPDEIFAKLSPYLRASARKVALPTPAQPTKRLPRPARPGRPVRPNVIAAE